MKLILVGDNGNYIDTYEDIEEYDLDDPDSTCGLMDWLQEGVNKNEITC